MRKALEKVLPDPLQLCVVMNHLRGVEHLADAYFKTAIIDLEMLNYRPAVMIFALFACSLELRFSQLLAKQEQVDVGNLHLLNQIFDRITVEVFGDQAFTNPTMPYIDDFGRYIFLRQKRIYEAYGKDAGLIHVYGEKAEKLFHINEFDHLVAKFTGVERQIGKKPDPTLQAFDIDWDMEPIFRQAQKWCIDPVFFSADTRCAAQL